MKSAPDRNALYLVEVSLESRDDDRAERFKRRMRDRADVLECYHVSGARPFVLLVALESAGNLADFARWLRGDNAGVASMRTSAVLDRVKALSPELRRGRAAPSAAPTARRGRACPGA